MNRKWLYLAIAFQLIALAWIAAKREWVVMTGETVYLRTAPIDPRDIFRGDYVRLDYQASTFSLPEMRDGLAEKEAKRGDVVYVPLELGARDLVKPRFVTDIEPESPPYLRGFVRHQWRGRKDRSTLQVKYGLEQYFVEQGKGLQIEQRRGTRTGIQIPLEMELALSDSGTAIIKGHRWSPLGIGLNVKRAVERDPMPGERSAILELTLQNASEAPLSLIMLPELCSFQLVSVKTAPLNLSLSRPECEQMQPKSEHLITLQPEESRDFIFDFNKAPWLINHKGQKTTIGTLEWGQRFRLVYTAARSAEAIQAGENTWFGALASRAFHGRGQID